MNKQCPECHKNLKPPAKRCSCGWKITEDQHEMIADYRCHYVILTRRCPLPGTMNTSPFGKTWYCCEHWQNLGDPVLCEAILINAEKNYEEIMKSKIDWRKALWEK